MGWFALKAAARLATLKRTLQGMAKEAIDSPLFFEPQRDRGGRSAKPESTTQLLETREGA
jgi:hypothetical protein